MSLPAQLSSGGTEQERMTHVDRVNIPGIVEAQGTRTPRGFNLIASHSRR